ARPVLAARGHLGGVGPGVLESAGETIAVCAVRGARLRPMADRQPLTVSVHRWQPRTAHRAPLPTHRVPLKYASVLLSQSSRGGENTSTSSVSSRACARAAGAPGGAAPPP